MAELSRAFGAGDDRHAGAVRPDAQLVDRGGPEGVARGEQHRIILLLEEMGELGDRRRLARAVDADDEDHLRPGEGVDLERLGDRSEDLLQLLRDHLADRILADPALEPFVGEAGADLGGGARAEIGGYQSLLDRVERLGIEGGAGQQPGQIVAEPVRRLAEPQAHAFVPAGFAHACTPISISSSTPMMFTSTISPESPPP
jgi:hypothetical protein